MESKRALILASGSPRRRELLRQIGLDFSVQPVNLDETPLAGEPADHYVERLARAKAMAVYESRPDDAILVLGADTTVVLDGAILGKPENRRDALAMLHRLSDRSHKVMSGVALAGDHGCYARVSVTEVCFRKLEEAEIEHYWHSGEPLDKAGAYGIQGLGAIFVAGLWGSYSGVVGLPLLETAELLAEAGAPVWRCWPTSAGERSP